MSDCTQRDFSTERSLIRISDGYTKTQGKHKSKATEHNLSNDYGLNTKN